MADTPEMANGGPKDYAGPLSQQEIDALLAHIGANLTEAPPTTTVDGATLPKITGSPAHPGPTSPPPAAPAGRVADGDWGRFARLSVTLTASLGETTLMVKDWFQVGIGSRVVLAHCMPNQLVNLKLNGVLVGVGRVVVVGSKLGVEVVRWGSHPWTAS